MKIRQSHALLRQPVNFWCLEIGIAKTAHSRITHVVDHDDDKVGLSICRENGESENERRDDELEVRFHEILINSYLANAGMVEAVAGGD